MSNKTTAIELAALQFDKVEQMGGELAAICQIAVETIERCRALSEMTSIEQRDAGTPREAMELGLDIHNYGVHARATVVDSARMLGIYARRIQHAADNLIKFARVAELEAAGLDILRPPAVVVCCVPSPLPVDRQIAVAP